VTGLESAVLLLGIASAVLVVVVFLQFNRIDDLRERSYEERREANVVLAELGRLVPDLGRAFPVATWFTGGKDVEVVGPPNPKAVLAYREARLQLRDHTAEEARVARVHNILNITDAEEGVSHEEH
jgi:hypothetical protein